MNNRIHGKDASLDQNSRTTIPQLRRWKQQYEIKLARVDHFGTTELRILLDGQVLLKTSELKNAVKESYHDTKGGGIRRDELAVRKRYAGTPRRLTAKNLSE